MAGLRRTWDKEAYEAKARRRAELGDEVDEAPVSKAPQAVREEFMPAPEDAKKPMGSERAFLKAREQKLDLDSKVGKTQIVTPADGEMGGGTATPGWFCEVCKCLLKDSASYLDHINGKKHQRALGYSMRVERAGVDRVKEKLDTLKRKISDQSTTGRLSAIEEYEARVAAAKMEEENRKKKKREEAEARKREEEMAEFDSGVDPDIALLMGFGGFGGAVRKS